MKNLRTIMALAAALNLGACASITSLTTAKTQKAGESEWTVAGSYSNLKLKESTADAASGTADFKTPGVDLAWRHGLTDNDEIGFRLANLSYLMGDYKRAIVRGTDFGLSLGAGMGGVSYSAGDSSHAVIDFYVPTVYLDYYASDSFTIFTAPKFIYRIMTGTGSENTSQLALSAGVKVGKTSGLIVEGGWTKFFQSGLANGWEFNAGYFF